MVQLLTALEGHQDFFMNLENLKEKQLQIFFWQPNEIPSIKVTQKQNVLVYKILACDLALLWGIRTKSEIKLKSIQRGIEQLFSSLTTLAACSQWWGEIPISLPLIGKHDDLLSKNLLTFSVCVAQQNKSWDIWEEAY